MKLICAPSDFDFSSQPESLGVVLYGRADRPTLGSVGAAVSDTIRRKNFHPAARSWDFLSIALSIVTADLAGHRNKSPDGWTREFELEIAVADPVFWTSQIVQLEKLLSFLTTDRWQLKFVEGGLQPAPDRDAILPIEDCVVLLSGGLDSFIGAIDLSSHNARPFAVSQSVRGDDEKQAELAALIGGGLAHLRINHNAHVPEPEDMPSQRARSIIFMAYGILMATCLARYHAGETVTLYVCENGFISINPPLTSARLGSLSTRTSHPVVLGILQNILNAAGLRVCIENPYRYKTKGEMLLEALDQPLLSANAHRTSSCGRFKRYGYRHCGRCVPCLIRRSAFNRWGITDRTDYVYQDLSPDDDEHARSDDVRSAAMAVGDVQQNGLDLWLGASLSSSMIKDRQALRDVAKRGWRKSDVSYRLNAFDDDRFSLPSRPYPNAPDVVKDVPHARIYILAVTTTPSAWEGTSALVANVSRIRVALGLHPQLAHERRTEIDLFDSLLHNSRYVGEIGLDGGPEFKPHWGDQTHVFEHILSACRSAGGRT